MRKVLVVLVLAGILALVLSVPAYAEPSDPPSAWGQAIKAYNLGSEDPFGQELSNVVHEIKAGDWAYWHIYNFGDLAGRKGGISF